MALNEFVWFQKDFFGVFGKILTLKILSHPLFIFTTEFLFSQGNLNNFNSDCNNLKEIV
jgi:hypothetical protein